MFTDKFKMLYDLAMKCFHSELEWEYKFDIIFLLVSEARQEIPFEWSDPDTDYEDDVRAVICAWQAIVHPTN